MSDKELRAKLKCEKGCTLKIADYKTEQEFDAQYKVLLQDKDGNELFYASGISNLWVDTVYQYRDYEQRINSLKSKIEVYERILDKFLGKLDAKYIRDEEE